MFFQRKIMNKISKINWTKFLPIFLSALSAIISLLTTLFIAKPLGTEKYGELQFYVGTIQTVSIVASIGLPNYLIKNSQNFVDKKASFTNFFVLSCCWSIIVYPVFFVIAFFGLNTFNKNSLLILISIACSFFYCLTLLIGAYFLGTFRQNLSILIENLIPRSLLFILCLFFLFALKKTTNFYYFYLFIYLFSYSVCSISFLFAFFKKTKFRLTKKELLSLLSFFSLSATYGLNTSLAKIIGSEFYKDLSDVGAYSLSVQIVSLADIFCGVINSMSKPYFSKYSKNKSELLNFFRQITRINCYFVVPLCAGFIIQSKSILSFFGNDYAEHFIILILLTIGTLFSNVTGPNGSLLAMSGHEKIEILNGVINIISFLICSFSFSFLEHSGLALATLVAVLLTNLIKIIEIIKIYKMNPYNFSFVLHVFLIFGISFLLFFLIDFINNFYIKFGVDLILGIIFILFCFVFSPYKDDKYFFIKKNDYN